MNKVGSNSTGDAVEEMEEFCTKGVRRLVIVSVTIALLILCGL